MDLCLLLEKQRIDQLWYLFHRKLICVRTYAGGISKHAKFIMPLSALRKNGTAVLNVSLDHSSSYVFIQSSIYKTNCVYTVD